MAASSAASRGQVEPDRIWARLSMGLG